MCNPVLYEFEPIPVEELCGCLFCKYMLKAYSVQGIPLEDRDLEVNRIFVWIPPLGSFTFWLLLLAEMEVI